MYGYLLIVLMALMMSESFNIINRLTNYIINYPAPKRYILPLIL